MGSSVVRSIIALVPLMGAAYEVWWALDRALGRSLWAQIGAVVLAYAAGGVAYCLAAAAMRMREIQDLVGILRRRREPRETDLVIDTEVADQ